MAFCKVITVTSYLLLVSYGIGLAQKHTIPECKRPLKEQQEAGDVDSSEVERCLKLADYGKYKSVIKNRTFSRGKGNPGHTGYVEADHIPPLDSLKKAKFKPEFGELNMINPALYDMVMSLENDPRGMKLFAVQVTKHHHRAALSTGSSRESRAVRGVLARRIARGEAVPMLKQAMMIAHPFVSQSMRDEAEARTTKIYKRGFLGLIDFNYNGTNEPKVITEEERDELKDYVRQHYALGGNFDKDSIEYQEILETVKRFTPKTNSLPRQKGIKKITKRVGKQTIKKQTRHVFPHQKRPKRQTLWSLIKFRCEYFCSLWSLKSLMTYNSILQTHLKEPYAFSTDSHIKV